MIRFAAIFLVVAAVGQTALADPTLDQSHASASPTLTAFIGPSNAVDWAQTFTAGLGGGLTSVEVEIFRLNDGVTAPLLFDLRTTAAGAPTEPDAGANILASVTIPAADVGTTVAFFSVDVSAFAIVVTPGDVLAIALRTDDPTAGAYRWRGTADDLYSGGAAFVRVAAGWGDEGRDLGFRTFVDPDLGGTIPEPSALLLLAAGAGFVVLRRRRAQR